MKVVDLVAAAPIEVTELVESVRDEVQRVYGVALDLTPETLPLVDQYLREITSSLDAEARAESLVAVGAYFGEVVRRKLGARWALGADPAAWRIELACCFLHFRPVGMAAEVLSGCETADYDGTFATLDELHDDLHAMLAQSAPMPEDEYYSLSGRVEVLTLVADWLVGRRLTETRRPKQYTADDYRQHLGE